MSTDVCTFLVETFITKLIHLIYFYVNLMDSYVFHNTVCMAAGSSASSI